MEKQDIFTLSKEFVPQQPIEAVCRICRTRAVTHPRGVTESARIVAIVASELGIGNGVVIVAVIDIGTLIEVGSIGETTKEMIGTVPIGTARISTGIVTEIVTIGVLVEIEAEVKVAIESENPDRGRVTVIGTGPDHEDVVNIRERKKDLSAIYQLRLNRNCCICGNYPT